MCVTLWHRFLLFKTLHGLPSLWGESSHLHNVDFRFRCLCNTEASILFTFWVRGDCHCAIHLLSPRWSITINFEGFRWKLKRPGDGEMKPPANRQKTRLFVETSHAWQVASIPSQMHVDQRSMSSECWYIVTSLLGFAEIFSALTQRSANDSSNSDPTP